MALDLRPISTRLAEHTRIDGATGCHLWEGYRVEDGYGQIKVRGIGKRVHRLAWEVAFGPIPRGLCVCHRCDKPNCINPAHLFLGTNADNVADKVRKGRARGAKCGADHHMATLSEQRARAILADSRTQQEIADNYGVSRSLVGLIKQGKRWPHLQGAA